jgi:hypothetical protein
MATQIVKGIEVNVPDDMKVIQLSDDRGDAIVYKDRQIMVADKDYKPDLRPGPFFVTDADAHMLEFNTLDECRAFIDRM